MLAHPGLTMLMRLFLTWQEQAWWELEVFHPDHLLLIFSGIKKWLVKYNLLVTGVLGLHGAGAGSSPFLGYVTVDSQHLEKMKKYKQDKNYF